MGNRSPSRALCVAAVVWLVCTELRSVAPPVLAHGNLLGGAPWPGAEHAQPRAASQACREGWWEGQGSVSSQDAAGRPAPHGLFQAVFYSSMSCPTLT